VPRIFEPILTTAVFLARVPAGVGTETLHVDFKRSVGGPLKAQLDLATDVAAFANAWGGTILVGVEEQDGLGGVRVGHVVGVKKYDGDRGWLEQAVRNCVDPPDIVIECAAIQVDGKVVLSANVHPEARLVAAWDRDKRVFYPRRTNHGNTFMTPNEIADRARASRRSGEIALRRAAEQVGHVQVVEEGAQVTNCPVDLGAVYGSGNSPMRIEAELVELRAHEFKLNIWPTIEPGMVKPAWLPYGLIREAWNRGDTVGLLLEFDLFEAGGSWNVRRQQ
jgi:hypothetical protein